MSPDKLQTCFWCHEQRPVDQDGLVGYHDYPVPCRMVCRGARWPSVERIAENAVEFQQLVSNYLDAFTLSGNIDQDRSEAMRREFPATSDWPRRLTTGAANPHPLLRLKIVKWIGEQLREGGHEAG